MSLWGEREAGRMSCFLDGVPDAEVAMKQTKLAFMARSNRELGPQAWRQEKGWRKDVGLATVHLEGALDSLWEARLVLSSDPVLAWGSLECSRLKGTRIWVCVHTAIVQLEKHDLPHATLG